jgi:hypothetical protein
MSSGELALAGRFRLALEVAAKTGDWTGVYPCLAPDVEITIREGQISRYEMRIVG